MNALSHLTLLMGMQGVILIPLGIWSLSSSSAWYLQSNLSLQKIFCHLKPLSGREKQVLKFTLCSAPVHAEGFKCNAETPPREQQDSKSVWMCCCCSEHPLHQQRKEKSMYVNQGIRWEGDLSTNRNRTGLLTQCQASEQIKDTAEAPSTAPG